MDLVESSSEETDGTRYFTPDTYANEHTATCASLAAAACADVATAVFQGRARSGAAIVRCAPGLGRTAEGLQPPWVVGSRTWSMARARGHGRLVEHRRVGSYGCSVYLSCLVYIGLHR